MKKTLIAKRIATAWLKRITQTEYRMDIFYDPSTTKNLPRMLRSHRDGNSRMAGLQPLPGLGMIEKFNAVTVWSTSRKGMIALKNWCEKRGLDTTGIW